MGLKRLLDAHPSLLPPTCMRTLDDLRDAIPPIDPRTMRPCVHRILTQQPRRVFSDLSCRTVTTNSVTRARHTILGSNHAITLGIRHPNVRHRIRHSVTLVHSVTHLVSTARFNRHCGIIRLTRRFTSTLRTRLGFRARTRCASRLHHGLSGDN